MNSHFLSGSPRRFGLPPSDQAYAPCAAGRANRLGEPLIRVVRAIRCKKMIPSLSYKPFSPENDSTGMLEFRNDVMMGKMNTGTGRGTRLRACGAVPCATSAVLHSRIHGGLS
jgi:hypothetical protein